MEEHDCNANDPVLLVTLKAHRNSVPIPEHWSQKRKYLQGKRGFLKPPFRLPDYIQATGISKMRETRLEALNEKSMKQKQREKVRPKKGGMEIDYAILHDAFFKHQTKPDMTGFGDIYHEGKEFEMRYRKFRPGFVLSPTSLSFCFYLFFFCFCFLFCLVVLYLEPQTSNLQPQTSIQYGVINSN